MTETSAWSLYGAFEGRMMKCIVGLRVSWGMGGGIWNFTWAWIFGLM